MISLLLWKSAYVYNENIRLLLLGALLCNAAKF